MAKFWLRFFFGTSTYNCKTTGNMDKNRINKRGLEWFCDIFLDSEHVLHAGSHHHHHRDGLDFLLASEPG